MDTAPTPATASMPATMGRLVSLADVRAAADVVAGRVVRTPLLPAPWVSAHPDVHLKPESLQPTGAFKLRGAINAVARLGDDRRAIGVVTHSSGNHAQALAKAAKDAGVLAVIVMPDDTPAVKVAATRGHGAEVHLVPADRRLSEAQRHVDERGLTLVPPFDSPDVVAGQGTVGLEIVEDLPDVGTVLVPVSGAGLISGIAVAVKALAPAARVVGVEPELAGDLAEGFRLGHRVEWPVARTGRTVADGLRVGTVADLTWRHVEALVDDVVTVAEDDILATMRDIVLRARLVCEPSGAVALAALTSGAVAVDERPVVAVVSGGNVEPSLLARVIG